MKRVKVNLDKRSYNVDIGSGAARLLPERIKAMGFTGPVVVITDRVVKAKTIRIVSPVLKKLKNDVIQVAVPAGERSKSLKVFQDTAQKISRKTKLHRPLIAALGGGVVGDLAGFIAATYRRGVPLIQVPTTLLAQVDSSIGGKVGVDLPEAKNLIGAFCQPQCVLADTDLLGTLPPRQIKNGLAEIIKCAVIKSRGLFDHLDRNMKSVLALKTGVMEEIICECVAIKARVVELDELDLKGIRVILNFGHTLGHAIETAGGYSKTYNHGEAIAVGMVLAGEIAVKLDMFRQSDLDRMKGLIKKAGLPVRAEGVSAAKIMDSYGYDKKFTAGTNRFVLPKRIGAVEAVEDIPRLLVKTVLRKYVG